MREHPPRVRGRTSPDRRPAASGRTSPARAGKNHLLRLSFCSRRKHPRVCGEELTISWARPLREETPPRVRGRKGNSRNPPSRMRNTPACAGKNAAMGKSNRYQQKHPRVCGEESTGPHDSNSSTETPPRVRGRKLHALLYRRNVGNTPACAGKKFYTIVGRRSLWKHPRVCGEELPPTATNSPFSETPPRVRGRIRGRGQIEYAYRNTPACAGKKVGFVSSLVAPEKHPRVCGEEDRRSQQLLRLREPPRVCGEECAQASSTPDGEETPPRVRGRTNGAGGQRVHQGNTPACAGKNCAFSSNRR